MHYYVNECFVKKIIDTVEVDSDYNIADTLTKAISRIMFENFREKLMIV